MHPLICAVISLLIAPAAIAAAAIEATGEEPLDLPANPVVPGQRALLSAHNCYPYHGVWNDRIDRALATGLPIAIEQDLCWVEHDGAMRSVVAHNGPFDGTETSLEAYFFSRVVPIAEAAIERAHDDPAERSAWPLVVLDLDLKDHDLAHVREVERTLRRHQPLLTHAVRGDTITDRGPLVAGPVLVLVGSRETHRAVFHDGVPVGGSIIAFGQRRSKGPDVAGLEKNQRAERIAGFPASAMIDSPADNFHRWWNNSWHVVEAGGAPQAGKWTRRDADRLAEIVDHAHSLGYFIRFYTVNGHAPADAAVGGYSQGYNTGSLEAARVRWRAMLDAGVDFIATDQYRRFAETRSWATRRLRSANEHPAP